MCYKIPACSVLYLSHNSYFHRGTWHTMGLRLSPFTSHNISALMWLGNARHPLTQLLPHFSRARGAESLIFPSFFFHIQCREAAIVAADVNDIRILRARGASRDHLVHQQPGPRLHLFFPKPIGELCASNDKLHGVPKV